MAGRQGSDPRPAARPRVLFLTHYYPPELGAPQTRLRETAVELQRLGHDVRVLTGPPHYPDGIVRDGYAPWAVRRERIDGVRIVRLPMWPRRNGGFVDRAIDQASFAAVAVAAVGEASRADVLLVESPPLFLGGTAAILRRMTGRPYLFHVADPWPDFPIAMGALTNPTLQRAAYALEALAYRSASLVTTVTPGLVELLETKAAARGKVRLLPNAVDTRRFDPVADPAAARVRLGWSQEGFHLVYAGSVGLAQGLGTLLQAAGPLQDRDVHIHVVGEGFERDRLAGEARQLGLRRVHFEHAVAGSLVPECLAAADGVLVLLRRGPLNEHSLPTKLLEGLAAGRPLLVSATGEASRIVDEAGAGLAVPAEDEVALRGAIERLTTTPQDERAAMGRRARALAERSYDRRLVVGRLAGYLEEVVGPGSASELRQ